MTNQEALLLEQGRVPMVVVQEALSMYLSTSDRTVKENLLVLSENAEVPYDTIETWLTHPDRFTSVEFNTADRFLCACYVWNWWYGRFSEYYEHVDLTWRTCACPGCSITFKPNPKSKGKKPIYCSKACANSASNMRTQAVGTKRFDGTDNAPKRMKDYGAAGKPRRKDVCRNGHKRTPENTIHLTSGKIRCRQCNNEASKRGYHNRRARAAA